MGLLDKESLLEKKKMRVTRLTLEKLPTAPRTLEAPPRPLP